MRACKWRAATLAALCAESLGNVAEMLRQKGPPAGWQFQELHRNLTGMCQESDMSDWQCCLLDMSDWQCCLLELLSRNLRFLFDKSELVAVCSC
jgi:hypothetical protein